MNLNPMKTIENWWFMGLLFFAVSLGLNYLLNAVSIPLIQVTMSTIDINIRQMLATNPSAAIANGIVGFLGISLTAPVIVMMLVSSMLIVLVGAYAFDVFGISFGDSPWMKLAARFVVGSILFSVLLGTLGGLDKVLMETILTTVGFSLIVSGVVVFATKFLDFIKLPVMGR